jgi:hypothetical protein
MMRLSALAALGLLALAGAGSTLAAEIAPARTIAAPGGPMGHYSETTITAAIEVDRDGATLVAYARKARPYERGIDAAFATHGEDAVLDVALLGPKDARYSLRIPVQGICFDHDASTPAHVEGDTIRLHRESYLVELPELAGFDRIEIAREAPGGLGARAPLGVVTLTPERFTAAGGTGRYEDLAFASVSPASSTGTARTAGTAAAVPSGSGPSAAPGLTTGAVHWPDEYGDPDKYTLWGDESEIDKRINIVLVPDGYTIADKATMQAHAQAMVNYFRNKTPYAEHDPFINYILVYAYSTQNGTDQCDCSVVRDTAMATRFPLSTPTCGSSDNRCLFYGNGNGGPNCDPNVSTANIAEAELRAPAQDKSIVMVNTTRYGGCGGARAVYSAGNGSATEIAVHELGHSLAGLADEYAYTAGCGSTAGEVNTSRNGVNGAWPEWISDLGPPFQGAQYYQSCLYRPENSCVMQALGLPFCRVCRQQWSLRFFSHFRINPTAPIESIDPPGSLSTQVGLPKTFTAVTRLSILGATNDFTWQLQGPGFPIPTTVSVDGPAYTRAFQAPGNYALTLELIADTNFIKKQRNGPNRDVATWYILATEVPEVSSDPIRELMLTKNGANVDMTFEDVGSTRYDLYVSTAPGTSPFAVASAQSGKKDCGLAGVATAGPGLLGVTNYDLGAGITGDTGLLCVLVTADNGPGTEGTLGHASNGAPRTADAGCNP